MRISKKFIRMCDIYKIFAEPWKDHLDFSDDAAFAMYFYETHGVAISAPYMNGYFVGKQWLNVTVSMWKEDITQKILFRNELYEDSKFPKWWLDKVI